MGQAGTGFRDRPGQRIDHRRFDPVGQMAGGLGGVVSAPAVLDLLVLGESVGDQREQPHVVPEDAADRLGRLPPDGGVGIGKQVKRLLAGQVLAADRKPERGHGLVEQPRPRRPAGETLHMKQTLGLLVQPVGAGQPDIA